MAVSWCCRPRNSSRSLARKGASKAENGLIEQKQARWPHQGARQRDPLLLPERKCRGPTMLESLQAEKFDPVSDQRTVGIAREEKIFRHLRWGKRPGFCGT